MFKISILNKVTGTQYSAKFTKEEGGKWVADCLEKKAWGEPEDLDITWEDITTQCEAEQKAERYKKECPSSEEMVHALILGDEAKIREYKEKLATLKEQFC